MSMEERETQVERREEQFALGIERAGRFESISILARGVAHDLNHDLGIIKNYLSFTLEDLRVGDTERASEDQKIVDSTISHAEGLARSLMAFSQAAESNPSSFDLNDAIMHVDDLIKSFDNAVATSFDLADNLRSIQADKGQVEQVVMNLAMNARDAMGQRGGMLKITTKNEIEGTERWVALYISDTGPGIPDDVKDHIFEPFFSTKGEEEDGTTGLGLAIVYGIVQRLEGRINVTSSEAGTTFRIQFPAER